MSEVMKSKPIACCEKLRTANRVSDCSGSIAFACHDGSASQEKHIVTNMSVSDNPGTLQSTDEAFFFQKEKSSNVRMACQCQDVSGTANSLGDQYRKRRSNTIHLLKE